MKRMVGALIAGILVVSFVIAGFADSKKAEVPDMSDVAGRIRALEAELAALKAMIRDDDPAVKTTNMPEDPPRKTGTRVFLDGTRGWDEDGTNMWTAVGALPNYNVGIGTTTPWVKLEVAGHIRANRGALTNVEVFADCSSNPAWDYAGIALSNGTYFPATRLQAFGPGHSPPHEFHIRHYPNAPIIFSTNNTERVRFAGNGNVGIGTNNPLYLLDINGSMRIMGGIHDGASFGATNQVLVADGVGGVAWAGSPGGSGDYIWNQDTAAQAPASFWIDGTGRVIEASPGASDTALVGITYDPGRRGVYGECSDVDGAGVGFTGVGGYFGGAAWYEPSAGYIGGVFGTYWGEGVWGLSRVADGGYTGVWGEGRDAGCTGVCGSGNGVGLSYWGGAGVSGCSDDVGVFGYGDATSASYGVLGRSDATDGIGTYGLSALATMFIPPAGQDAGLFAAGKYYGLFAMGQRQADHGIGVAGLGDSTTNLIYVSGTGVIGCGVYGVFGCPSLTTGMGVVGYNDVAGGRWGLLGGQYSGVQGTSDNTSGAGVFGQHTAASASARGIYGTLTNTGTYDYSAVYGYDPNYADFYGYGGRFYGGYRGVYGYTNYDGSIGVYGREPTGGSGYAVYGSGDMGCSGVKPAVVRTSEGPTELYAMESPELWFEDFGSGQLVNGRAHVELEALFLETVTIDGDNPMKAFVTLTDNCYGVFVKKTDSGFDVIELNGGTSNATFDYRVIAKRKGYEERRLAVNDAAYVDPVLYPNPHDPEIPSGLRDKRLLEEESSITESASVVKTEARSVQLGAMKRGILKKIDDSRRNLNLLMTDKYQKNLPK